MVLSSPSGGPVASLVASRCSVGSMHLVLPLLPKFPVQDLGSPRVTPTSRPLCARRLQHPEVLRGGDERTHSIYLCFQPSVTNPPGFSPSCSVVAFAFSSPSVSYSYTTGWSSLPSGPLTRADLRVRVQLLNWVTAPPLPHAAYKTSSCFCCRRTYPANSCSVRKIIRVRRFAE